MNPDATRILAAHRMPDCIPDTEEIEEEQAEAPKIPKLRLVHKGGKGVAQPSWEK